MMRSLFSGVSGLKAHQTGMDVIGNNIANVNTTGFKSSRTTFADTLSQTLTGASAPGDTVGGTNPKQIGLGTGVASIDLLFTDGSVQSTGKNTDLCLSGNGLFVVKNGNQTYYTRDGAFEFDSAGNYVLPSSGLYVQGWTATDGVLNTTGAVGNINIPAGKSMASKATSLATYANNLNASTTGYKISNVLVKYTDGTSETVTNYTPVQSSAGTISLTLASGETVTLDENAGYNFETGQPIAGKVLYKSKISSITANANGKVNLTLGVGTAINNIDGATTYNVQNLASGTYSIDGKYTLAGTITKVTAKGTDNVDIELDLDGDGTKDITVNVPKPDNFSYSAGDEFKADLPITKIDAKQGAQINMANGKVANLEAANLLVDSADQMYERKGTTQDGVVTAITRKGDTVYNFNGKTVASTTITTDDGNSLTGLVGMNYAAKDTFYPSVTTTIQVYDSLGASHSVPVLFTKTADNTWNLSLAGGGDSTTITEEDGTSTVINLTATELKFDTAGKYVSGSASLALTYTNGAEAQNVAANLAGLSQYAGNSTINAGYDGHAAGTLSSVAVDSSGIITGTYTNGVKQAEGQVAIAQFTNASGLTKTGNSLYQESNNSGTANVKTASDLGVTITPSALEMSNVDIANEFSNMIVTQRGFQSNSKIITVGDEMLETLINMKR